jgi:hypothetical protein
MLPVLAQQQAIFSGLGTRNFNQPLILKGCYVKGSKNRFSTVSRDAQHRQKAYMKVLQFLQLK